MIEFPDTIAEYEVSGTVTTGVRIYCPDCREWFAEWSSREKFPTVAVIIETCMDHRMGCPEGEEPT